MNFLLMFCFTFLVIFEVCFPGLLFRLAEGFIGAAFAGLTHFAEKEGKREYAAAYTAQVEARKAHWESEKRKNDEIIKSYNKANEQEKEMKATEEVIDGFMAPLIPTLKREKNEQFHFECLHCKRALTDPDSIARGVGPECAEKHELDHVAKELLQDAEKSMKYVAGPGMFVEQKYQSHVNLIKKAFTQYIAWKRPEYLKIAASAINRLEADTEIKEFLDQNPLEVTKFIVPAKIIQNKHDKILLNKYL